MFADFFTLQNVGFPLVLSYNLFMPKIKDSKANNRRYMLVDGNALIHRAFHAIAHLSTKSGEQTNAVYGFAMFILKALKEIKPTHVAITFDLDRKTFRHEKYKEYKAHRVEMADELFKQMPKCKEVVRSLGMPIYEMQGYEADDMLGTLSAKIEQENKGNPDYEIIIVTGDLDTLQLVDGNTKVYTSRKGLTDVIVYDLAAVKERYGITPGEFLDFKAIKGDPSDNIPGVKGIGEIGALNLIEEFGSIENIYKNLDKLKPKYRQLFEEQKDQVLLSYELSKIVRDAPIEYFLPKYEFSNNNYENAIKLFQELEFKSLISKLPEVQGADKIPEQDQAVAAKIKSNYQTVDNLEKFSSFVGKLSKQKEFVFKAETEDLGALDHDLVGISFCFEEGGAWYIPAEFIKNPGEKKPLAQSQAYKEIKEIFENQSVKKIAHNIKYDYLVMKRFGIEIENLYFDTMIASYLLSPGSRAHDLSTLAFNEFGYQIMPIEELVGKGKKQISAKDIPLQEMCSYCCENADFTLRLKNILLQHLIEEKLDKIFFEIEMPLTKVLAQMEENGILLDTNHFVELEKRVDKELKSAENKIYKLAGEEFNINSPSQLKVILFEKLNIPVNSEEFFIRKVKTGYSTAASELEKMRGMHEIIDVILAYRELAKLQNTYISALPQLVGKDGRLHTSFNQTITATGRLSSSNPNLQNLPVRSEGVAGEIRKGFIADKGKKLLAVDYSQIELRVVAHLSGDKTMTEVFENNEDIHMATAMQLYGISDPSKITKEMRRDAKTINFGVLYGVSSFGLSERVDMSRQEAAEFIKKYFQAFPAVKKYLDDIISQTREKGYVQNELGRRRIIPEINSSQFQIRSAAERAAINMPIQSLAADIVKIAMNNISKIMDVQSEDIKLLLQIHDELVFEVKEDRAEMFGLQIKEIMQNAYKLKVPLVADVKISKTL